MAWGAGQWGWGTFGDSVDFNVTDSEVLSLIQLAMLEPDDGGQTWPSGIWTKQQVVAYLNDRQRQFLKDTGAACIVQYQGTTPAIRRYNLPEKLIDLRRLAWAGVGFANYTELARTDQWALDNSEPDWSRADGEPERYVEFLLPSLTVELTPAPTDAGEMEATYVSLGTPATGDGAFLVVPDDYTWVLKYGVMADMLAQEGEGNDPARAAYCEQRFAEGVQLAKLLLAG